MVCAVLVIERSRANDVGVPSGHYLINQRASVGRRTHPVLRRDNPLRQGDQRQVT